MAGCSTTDSSQRALREEELLLYKCPSVPNAFLPFLHPSNSYSLLSAQPTRSPPLPHSEKSPHVPPKPLCSKDVSPDSLAHLLLRVEVLRKQKVFPTFRTPVPSTRTNLDFPLSVSSQSATSSSQEVQSPDLVLESLGSPSLLWGSCLYAFGLEGDRP